MFDESVRGQCDEKEGGPGFAFDRKTAVRLRIRQLSIGGSPEKGGQAAIEAIFDMMKIKTRANNKVNKVH